MNHEEIRNLPLVRETLKQMEAEKPLGQSRRRFAQAGLGAGLFTMAAGRPVWANHCTVSGMLSGNMSRYQSFVTCRGCPTTFWATDGDPAGNNGNLWPIEVAPATLFQEVGVGFTEATMAFNSSMLETLQQGPTSVRAQAVAALLNAYSGQHGVVNPHDNWFGLEPDQVRHLYNSNFSTDPMGLLNTLQMMNDRGGCPV